MPKHTNNHPAFPVQGYPGDAKNPSVRPNTGMGIMDWFAAMALIGYRASEKYSEEHPDIVADLAYQDAEAMLKRKEENKYD
jgi:hypothetical protein